MMMRQSISVIFAVFHLHNVYCKTDAKVLILGAGAAGMSAAKTLTEQNMQDFIILEGSNRIGGRVKSVRFGGKTVEAGANVIIGKTNPLFQIAKEINLRGKVSDYDNVVIRNSTGADVTETEGVNAWTKLKLAQKQIPYLERRLDGGRSDMSLRACLTGAGFTPKSPVEKIVESFGYDFENGNVPDVSSCLLGFSNNKLIEGTFFVQDQRGYESVLDKYFEGVLSFDDQRLILNEVVTHVKYSSLGVEVTTKNGNIYTADYAIMTFSVGVLKSGSVTFSPMLPDWKRDSINRVRLENYFGVFLKFPDGMQRFWDDGEFILYADERKGFYPVWLNHEADGFYPAGANILEIVTFGEEADRVSAMEESDVVAEVMEILRRVYKDPSIPDPEDVFIPNWVNDPLYLGSFVNMEPGALHPKIVEKRLTPIGRLHFAGEAFDAEIPGYVFAALRSGREEAIRVNKRLHHSNCLPGNCHQQTFRSRTTFISDLCNFNLLFHVMALSILEQSTFYL